MKEPWATPNGATHKTCYPFQKKRDNSRKKSIKTSKKSKKIFKNPKKIKKTGKTAKNVKKTREKESGSEAGAKRERSGSKAGAKRQARKPWKTVKKR